MTTTGAELLGRSVLINFERRDKCAGAGKTTNDKGRDDVLPLADLQRYLPVVDRDAPVQQISS
jgi:hypothetical protein